HHLSRLPRRTGVVACRCCSMLDHGEGPPRRSAALRARENFLGKSLPRGVHDFVTERQCLPVTRPCSVCASFARLSGVFPTPGSLTLRQPAAPLPHCLRHPREAHSPYP